MQQSLGQEVQKVPQAPLETTEDVRRRRRIPVSFFLVFMIFWGVLAFGGGGYTWFRYSEYLDKLLPAESQEKAKIQKVIDEKPVYYAQSDEERYIDRDSTSETFSELLNASRQHFEFESVVSDGQHYKEYEEFILVNLENQLSRLSAKFDIELQKKLQVVLIDDFEKFKVDMELDLDEEPALMAFSSKGEKIEIFLPTDKPTMDKFILASTLSHELVHVFQYHKYIYIFDKKASLTWLYEGMAENLTYPKEDSLIRNDLSENIKSLSDLNSRLTSSVQEDLTIGYAVAEQFYGYLVEIYGEDTLNTIFGDSLSDTVWRNDLNDSFRQNINLLPEEVFQKWLEKISTSV